MSEDSNRRQSWIANDRVVWHRTRVAGLRFDGSIPEIVVRVTARRVTIDAELRGGGVKRVSVRPEHLRLAPEQHAR